MPSKQDWEWLKEADDRLHSAILADDEDGDLVIALSKLHAAWEREEKLEKALRRLSEVAIDLIPSPHANEETEHEFEMAMQQAEQALASGK